MTDAPVVIFDGNCGFCRIWIDYFKLATHGALSFTPAEDAHPKAVQLELPVGPTLQAAEAIFGILRYSPEHRWLVWIYDHLPPVKPVTQGCYKFIADHRSLAFQVSRFLFGRRVEPARYQTVEWLFLKALALIFLAAFASLAVQVSGLVGSDGILPASRYLPLARQAFGISAYWTIPGLFWINSSDIALKLACVAGVALSVVLLLGFFRRTCLILLFVLYLSLCSVGQDFLSFQWDMLLLESGFLAIFLGSSRIVVWLFRWLLFRLMFLSGAVKLLSQDPAWRDLTALGYHYWTQPLPMPLAWYMSQFPAWFQRVSTFGVFVIELAVPFLIWTPRIPRMVAAWLLILLQVLILLTGNYAFFNVLTIALCVFLFDDKALRAIPISSPAAQQRGLSRTWREQSYALILLAIVGTLSSIQLAGTFFGSTPAAAKALMRLAAPFGIVNSYGLFAVMTTSRPEIIVQGSNDGVNWSDYEFRYKPGDLRRAPQWVAPHQPRLDWQMWFAALSTWQENPWFANFMVRLLEGSPPVLHLIKTNPFPEHPPRFVRAVIYDYRFTDFAERRSNGNWWKRNLRGEYFPSISLENVKTPDSKSK